MIFLHVIAVNKPGTKYRCLYLHTTHMRSETILVIACFLVLCVNIAVSLGVYYGTNQNSEALDAGGASCVTMRVQRTDGFGSHLVEYLVLQLYGWEKGKTACDLGHDVMEHASGSDKAKLMKLFNWGPPQSCSGCQVLKDIAYDPPMQKKLFAKYKDRLISLYSPPAPFPVLLDRGCYNITVHHRTLVKIDVHRDEAIWNHPITTKHIKYLVDKAPKDKPVKVHIFTQAAEKDKDNEYINKLAQETGAKLHRETDPADTFDAMVRSDVLVTFAKSNFSAMAGLIHKGPVYVCCKDINVIEENFLQFPF